jgi:hypothetical protein
MAMQRGCRTHAAWKVCMSGCKRGSSQASAPGGACCASSNMRCNSLTHTAAALPHAPQSSRRCNAPQHDDHLHGC